MSQAQRIQLGPFFDQGQLCGAALLEHYDAGTSTLKDIWSDAAQTTTLAQPFVSDANGIFNFFASGNYKLVLKKADGQVLHTLDNWRIIDQSQPFLSMGIPVATASTMALGDSTWAHWTGSVNVATLSGSALFYWAIADGNFSLIHSSSLLLPDQRNRKVLSGDALLFLNEGGSVWRLAAHMQKEGGWTGRQGATVSTSATLAVPTDGDFIDISGGSDITAVGVAAAGYRFRARFTASGLNIIHDAIALISPWGRSYRTIPNEIIEFQSFGAGNWMFYSVNGPKERVGQSVIFDSATVPAGFLARDGAAVSRTTYPGLFQEIGTTYGPGDGGTTFNVPDARGRVDMMIDGSANRITSASTGGVNADTLGGVGGAETHTLATSEMPGHTHTVSTRASVGTFTGAGADGWDGVNSTNTGSTGGGGAHSNTQPWIATNKYIRF